MQKLSFSRMNYTHLQMLLISGNTIYHVKWRECSMENNIAWYNISICI